MHGPCVLRRNVGDADRIIRIVTGAALIAVPAVLNWTKWGVAVSAAIGGVQILEGITRY